MPNWVRNQLTIHGTAEELDTIAATVCGDRLVLSFASLIPRPADVGEWYDWNVTNWGTKWDACRPVVDRDGDTLTYTFETAWTPPEPFMAKFTETFNTVRFEWAYEEEQGWGGSVHVDAGQVIATDTYDIPSSHNDYAARTTECPCTYIDEPPFDDCYPTRLAAIADLSETARETAVVLGRDWFGTFDELVQAARQIEQDSRPPQ